MMPSKGPRANRDRECDFHLMSINMTYTHMYVRDKTNHTKTFHFHSWNFFVYMPDMYVPNFDSF
jgi:hypothetical protein